MSDDLSPLCKEKLKEIERKLERGLAAYKSKKFDDSVAIFQDAFSKLDAAESSGLGEDCIKILRNIESEIGKQKRKYIAKQRDQAPAAIAELATHATNALAQITEALIAKDRDYVTADA